MVKKIAVKKIALKKAAPKGKKLVAKAGAKSIAKKARVLSKRPGATK